MIQVENLSYVYPESEKEVVHNVSFSIKKGEIFGFLGPSGAGKSTTQKVLIRLLSGYRGAVTILGRDLNEWDNKFYERIGVGFEFPNHYSKLSAEENLQLFGSLYSRKVDKPEDILARVGLENDIHTRVGQFSKGMKMRLGFARAIMHDPDIIFLDEPTSGLDPANARKIKEIIKEKNKRGKTVFLTTHNMFDADELCHRVAFIVDGQIKIVDSPRELKLMNAKHRVKVEYLHEKISTAREFDMAGLGFNLEFIELLQKEEIQTIHSQEYTLEDVFIKETGRSLT